MRYLPISDADRQRMLAKIGVASVDDLFNHIPAAVRLKKPLDLPHHQGEMEVERHMTALAAKNIGATKASMFLGAGAYNHHIPAAVDHLIQRGEFLTSYTPYQPELAQGTLQYLFEFQTQVAMITGMEVANASMYDGSTAAAEAVMMANRITKRQEVIVSSLVHPHYLAVIETHARFGGFKVTSEPMMIGREEKLTQMIHDQISCVVVQTPDFFGSLHDFTELAKACQAKGALLIVIVTEIISLGLLKSPGEMGADIVVAEGQSLGNALSFGGPYVGLFATREKYIRQMPGRLAGQTTDADGKRGWVLTLSTREQHIRREKATSNICTNSGLCALAFTIHLSLLGEVGFRRLAETNHARASLLASEIGKIRDVSVINKTFFNEFTVVLPKSAKITVDRLASYGIMGGIPMTRFYGRQLELSRVLLICATEMNTENEIESFAKVLRKVLND